MATLKQRLHRKNASGTYDTVHFESSSDLILRPSGRTVEQDLADYLPEVQANDNVPESLKKLTIGTSKSFIHAKTVAYVEDDVNPLKTSVSEGKALVAAAVTDKGVSTAADATFQQIANNINLIQSLLSISSGQFFVADCISETSYTNDSDARAIVVNGDLTSIVTVGKKIFIIANPFVEPSVLHKDMRYLLQWEPGKKMVLLVQLIYQLIQAAIHGMDME